MDRFTKVGWIGETYVMHQLAKLGIISNKPGIPTDYDLLADNGARIEVKTSMLIKAWKGKPRKDLSVYRYFWNRWQFANHKTHIQLENGYRKQLLSKRDRKCDFFALVCLDDNYNVIKTYIVPKEDIGTKRIIAIGEKERGQGKNEGIYIKFKDRWDLVQNFI